MFLFSFGPRAASEWSNGPLRVHWPFAATAPAAAVQLPVRGAPPPPTPLQATATAALVVLTRCLEWAGGRSRRVS
jgi:hypothetical protein